MYEKAKLTYEHPEKGTEALYIQLFEKQSLLEENPNMCIAIRTRKDQPPVLKTKWNPNYNHSKPGEDDFQTTIYPTVEDMVKIIGEEKLPEQLLPWLKDISDVINGEKTEILEQGSSIKKEYIRELVYQ